MRSNEKQNKKKLETTTWKDPGLDFLQIFHPPVGSLSWIPPWIGILPFISETKLDPLDWKIRWKF